MEKETIVERTLLVDAAPMVIWKVLTEPELSKLYMDGWMVRSTWRRGAPIVWTERVEGETHNRAKGTIMASLPGRRLRYTQYMVSSGLPDSPESYNTVDISLSEEKDGRTKVHLWHGDFAGLPDDVRRAREAGRKWVEALVGLKRTAEEQQGALAA